MRQAPLSLPFALARVYIAVGIGVSSIWYAYNVPMEYHSFLLNLINGIELAQKRLHSIGPHGITSNQINGILITCHWALFQNMRFIQIQLYSIQLCNQLHVSKFHSVSLNLLNSIQYLWVFILYNWSLPPIELNSLKYQSIPLDCIEWNFDNMPLKLHVKTWYSLRCNCSIQLCN